MNEDDRWIYLDGPEPERIRPLLAALREATPATPEGRERFARTLLEKLDARLAGAPAPQVEEDEESAASTQPRAQESAVVPGGATIRSPVALDEDWQGRFAKQPELRAAFERAFAEYAEWLRRQRR